MYPNRRIHIKICMTACYKSLLFFFFLLFTFFNTMIIYKYTEQEWRRPPCGRGKVRGWWETYVGSSEKRELQQGPSTAILQCQQEGGPRPEQLRAGLLQVIEVFTVARHKIIVSPV